MKVPNSNKDGRTWRRGRNEIICFFLLIRVIRVFRVIRG